MRKFVKNPALPKKLICDTIKEIQFVATERRKMSIISDVSVMENKTKNMQNFGIKKILPDGSFKALSPEEFSAEVDASLRRFEKGEYITDDEMWAIERKLYDHIDRFAEQNNLR